MDTRSKPFSWGLDHLERNDRGEPSPAGGPEFWTLLNPGQEKRSNNPLDDGGGRCMYVIMLRANDGFGEPRDKAKQPCLIYLSSTSTKWPFALHHTIHQSSLMLWWWWLAWLQYDNLDFTFSPPTGMKSFLYAQLKDVCKPTPSSSSCCQWCLNFVGWVRVSFFLVGFFLGRTSNYLLP